MVLPHRFRRPRPRDCLCRTCGHSYWAHSWRAADTSWPCLNCRGPNRIWLTETCQGWVGPVQLYGTVSASEDVVAGIRQDQTRAVLLRLVTVGLPVAILTMAVWHGPLWAWSIPLLYFFIINNAFIPATRYPWRSWRSRVRGAVGSARILDHHPAIADEPWFARGPVRDVIDLLIEVDGQPYWWCIYEDPGLVLAKGQLIPITVTSTGWAYGLTETPVLPHRPLNSQIGAGGTKPTRSWYRNLDQSNCIWGREEPDWTRWIPVDQCPPIDPPGTG